MDESGERRAELLNELRANLGDAEYYDLPFKSTLLALHAEDPELPPPYMVTHGYMFEADFLVPNGQVHALRFCRLVEDFITYYSHITGFCTCRICDANNKCRTLCIDLLDDFLIRRYSPMDLFRFLEEVHPESLNLKQILALLVRCRNFGLMERAHAQSLITDVELCLQPRG